MYSAECTLHYPERSIAMSRCFWILVLAAACTAPHRLPAQWVQTAGPVGGCINAFAEDDSFFYSDTDIDP